VDSILHSLISIYIICFTDVIHNILMKMKVERIQINDRAMKRLHMAFRQTRTANNLSFHALRRLGAFGASNIYELAKILRARLSQSRVLTCK